MADYSDRLKNIVRQIPFYSFLRKKHREYVIKLHKLLGKEIFHFLHIGKTAGTSIKYAFNQTKLYTNKNLVFVLHHHGFRLPDVPEDERVFFIVRDPIDRYVSGFYSRYRKGQPRIYNPWNNEEAEVFGEFKTPNEMAKALSSSNLELAELAKKGFNNIGHVNTSYWDWFLDEQYLEKRLNSIGYVAEIRNLDESFESFKSKYGIGDSVSLPTSQVKKHANPDGFDKSLEPEAEKNLKDYYSREYDFLNYLYKKGLIGKKYS